VSATRRLALHFLFLEIFVALMFEPDSQAYPPFELVNKKEKEKEGHRKWRLLPVD